MIYLSRLTPMMIADHQARATILMMMGCLAGVIVVFSHGHMSTAWLAA
jgi:hypothetical protein